MKTTLSICSSMNPNTSGQHEQIMVKASDPRNRAVHIRLVPHVSFSSSHCYVFDIIEREMHAGTTLKIGRYNSSHENIYPNCLSFKSKVVSRSHADIWSRDGNVYIRDVGSSSGTFVNRTRLFQNYHHQLRDGDIIQLGVDYQSGTEPAYRAVRMKIEISSHARCDEAAIAHYRRSHHKHQQSELTAYSKTAYEQIQNDFIEQNKAKSQECCICLCGIAPTQALFLAPCFHVFHFKCMRLFIEQHFPAFLCPLCRTYSDLNASVSVEDLHIQTEDESHQQSAMPAPLAISTSDSDMSSLSDPDDNGSVVVVIVTEPEPRSCVLPRPQRRPVSSYVTSSSSAPDPAFSTGGLPRTPRHRLSASKRCSFLGNAMISSPSFLKQMFGNRTSNS